MPASARAPRRLFLFPSIFSTPTAEDQLVRKPRPRICPSAAIVVLITVAFLVFAAIVARSVSTSVIPPVNLSYAPANNPTEPNSANLPNPNSNPNSNSPVSASNARAPANPPAGAPPASAHGAKPGASSNRSWPLSPAHDTLGLLPLAERLAFSNSTMLDYFHLHKTGGVTMKSLIRTFLARDENKVQMTYRGQPLRSIETCYKSESPLSKLSARNVNWRCDFRRIREMSVDELRSVDVVLGHQYWNRGCEHYFGAQREIRYFSIFRHPLSRKLSFYHHFFVRNLNRDEKSVPRDEIVKFLLAEDLPNDPRMRDAGPNYFVSRMMSNGMSGFQNNVFPVAVEEQDAVLSEILDRLDKLFVFIGLQLQNDATQCMMQKTMQLLAHAHGIDTMVGWQTLGESGKWLNSGKYRWTAQTLWKSMSAEEKRKYKEVERLDLAIYKKAVEKFKEDVKLFSCEDKVDASMFAEDVFE